MKKNIAALMLIGFLAPLSASAASVADIEEQVMFMLGRMAAVQALTSHSTVACALATSKAVVHVGEPYELIWNTYGATEGADQYAPRGIETVTMTQSGTYTYKMTFKGEMGAEATCLANVVILR